MRSTQRRGNIGRRPLFPVHPYDKDMLDSYTKYGLLVGDPPGATGITIECNNRLLTLIQTVAKSAN